ncbi:hypothetical protein GGI43DRAFT_68414 [Trichoderma evansii]
MAHADKAKDHETFWPDNEDLKEKTKAYADRAQSAAKKEIFGNLVHPWMEPAYPSSWKFRIFDWEKGYRVLSNGDELEARDSLLQWEGTRKEGERKRCVILLDDLHPRIAELLGVLLDIPPEFFLAHCVMEGELSVVNKQMFKQGSSKYWKVAVPQRRLFPRRMDPGLYHTFCGSFYRGAFNVRSSTNDRTKYFDSYVSYWASSHGVDSWTAIVVTDPHQSQEHFYPASDPKNREIVSTINAMPPSVNPWHEIILDSAQGEFGQPHERSIFDAAASACEDLSLEVVDDPYSATHFVRNYIRAAWEQRVWWDDREVRDTVYRNVWSHETRQTALTLEDLENETVINKESMADYQGLMGQQQKIRANRNELRAIIYKFCRRDTDYMSSKTPELQMYMKQETESWKFIEEKLHYIEEFLTDHMKMYSVRSTMEEAYEAKMQSRESMRQTKEANRQTAAANRMARSSGQLTKIATIIVPCTFVASIFSMGGDFAAGQSLFYVYWIISVPITLGLLSWILHEDIADAVEKSKGWITSRTTKSSEKLEE